MRFLCLLCLLIFAPAVQAASFSSTYVETHIGRLIQGGLMMLQLTPGTTLALNNRPVSQVDGLVLIGFGRDAPLEQELVLMRKGKSRKVMLKLKQRDYNVQRIDGLPPAMVTPPLDMIAAIKAQVEQKFIARQNNTAAVWFANDFIWPTKGRITGVYGSQRFYNGEPRRPHLGVDIAAPKGTPVYAPAPGVVSLAEPNMYFEGGLIFLDHGLRLTSALMHLDRIDVKPGEFVKSGQQIGTVGATGRATGPHLDWRMFWFDQRVDPSLLVPPPKNGKVQ